MNWIGYVLAGIGIFLLGMLAGWGLKRLLCSGRLIVTEVEGARDIFLELDDESAVLEHYVLLEVRRHRSRKNPGGRNSGNKKEDGSC